MSRLAAPVEPAPAVAAAVAAKLVKGLEETALRVPTARRAGTAEQATTPTATTAATPVPPASATTAVQVQTR